MRTGILSLLAATAVIVLSSCETIPEPTKEEGYQTQANILREQGSLNRQAAAQRSRADEIENASRMMHRGAADHEPVNDQFDREYRAAQDRAEELDTASRMMGRGAAN